MHSGEKASGVKRSLRPRPAPNLQLQREDTEFDGGRLALSIDEETLRFVPVRRGERERKPSSRPVDLLSLLPSPEDDLPPLSPPPLLAPEHIAPLPFPGIKKKSHKKKPPAPFPLPREEAEGERKAAAEVEAEAERERRLREGAEKEGARRGGAQKLEEEKGKEGLKRSRAEAGWGEGGVQEGGKRARLDSQEGGKRARLDSQPRQQGQQPQGGGGGGEESGVYEIERIVAMRPDVTGRAQYKIKWLGFDNRYNSWIYEENMDSREQLTLFQQQQQQGEGEERQHDERQEQGGQEAGALQGHPQDGRETLPDSASSAPPPLPSRPPPEALPSEGSTGKFTATAGREKKQAEEAPFLLRAQARWLKGDRVQRILGVTRWETKLLLRVEWLHKRSRLSWLPSSFLAAHEPQVLIAYYESKLTL